MPDCNLPKNHAYDYCMTIALGYLTGVIPETMDEKVEHMDDAEEVVQMYLTFG